MARITVEDCLDNIDNIFEMVMVAAKRARRIAHGADPMVELENDKPTVLALREIAEGHVTPAILDEAEQTPADELMQACAHDDLARARRAVILICSMSRSTCRARSTTSFPTGVSCTLRGARSTSCTPSSSSSFRICVLSVGWLTKQGSAARLKCCSSASLTRY